MLVTGPLVTTSTPHQRQLDHASYTPQLKTGEAAQLRAMGVHKEGSREEVVVQRSVAGASVTVEAASGSVLTGQPGKAELSASAAGVNAVRTLKVVQGICVATGVKAAWAIPGSCALPVAI